MAGPTAGPDDTQAAHDLHGHGVAHTHVLSGLQEEVFCWAAGCFVVVAIAFAIWTLRTAPAPRPRRGKRRSGRRARRLRAKRR